MANYIVGIDVETTSLDPTTGDIIEVAAIRFNQTTGEEVDRLVRLCKPREAITAEIATLTGITNEMVETAAPFSDIADEMSDFIGTDTVFAHNATFDVDWLTHHGVTIPPHVWDTFPLASIVWPEAESYNLGTLTDILGLNQEQTTLSEHRAGDDVVMTYQLLQAVRTKLVINPETHKKVVAVLEQAQLNHYLPLFTTQEDRPPETPKKESRPPRTITATPASFFAATGALSKKLPTYRLRTTQLEMSERVQETLTDGGVTLIEAPTGTGKSLAYLLPALRHAAEGKRVLVSTHTKHLQDQLLNDDIPLLFTALEASVAVAVLKGRRNYVCGARLEAALQQKTIKPPDAFILLKLLVWLDHGGTGELDALNTSHQESWVFDSVHADALSCRQGCAKPTQCYYKHARDRAESAQLVIVNHALLARMSADLEQRLSAEAIIVDEGHQLEKAVRDSTELYFSARHLAELLAPFVQKTNPIPEVDQRHIHAEAKSTQERYTSLLDAMAAFLHRTSPEERLRLTPAVRRQAAWQKIVKAEEDFRNRVTFLSGLIEGAFKKEKPALILEALHDLKRFAVEFQVFIEGSKERIQWLERDTYRYGDAAPLVLRDVALSVAATMEPLYSETKSIVVTSATLTVAGSWRHLEQRLGITEASHLVVASPFNLSEQLLVYIVTDGPIPNDPTFTDFTSSVLIQLSHLLGGRTLGLFTSLKAIKEVYHKSLSELNKATIKLYAQGLTGGRRNMLRRFTAEPKSVLLGADSFWEGVDIPGETLSAVVIPKLPFPPPFDPVIDAVAEAENIHPFFDLSIPTMILKLRQGMGRLIRTETDHGIIFLLDQRLKRSRYGADVLASFPEATILHGSTDDALATATKWMSKKNTPSTT